MAALAGFLRPLVTPPNTRPAVDVLDHTGLNGTYDFDLNLTLGMSPAALQNAIDSQLGLKLEAIQIPARGNLEASLAERMPVAGR